MLKILKKFDCQFKTENRQTWKASLNRPAHFSMNNFQLKVFNPLTSFLHSAGNSGENSP